MTAADTFYHASLVKAWSLGAACVAGSGHASFYMIVSAGNDWEAAAPAIRALNSAAAGRGWERPGSVAEMLLPRITSLSGGTPAEAIEIYIVSQLQTIWIEVS